MEEKMSARKKMYFTSLVSALDRRLLLIISPFLALFVFLYLSKSATTTTTTTTAAFNPFFRNFFCNGTIQLDGTDHKPTALFNSSVPSKTWKEKLNESKIAVCLVGGARKFELTGPSIVENILNEYPNSDLFLHSPLDGDSFKFSLLKVAPRLASIRIFHPKPIPETPSHARLLTHLGSPNGIQGLLQYFNLVEGCLTLIKAYQNDNNFTYDWIVRARVDGYWNAPLDPESFVPGQYVVPSGSTYYGLNDRHGVGDFNTSTIALSRLSILPQLVSAGLRNLNSESAFKAQFTTQGVPYVAKRLPFCVVTDRSYPFPPVRTGVPVAATSSPGPLSGVKCRPCSSECKGQCVVDAMRPVKIEWGWTDWEDGSLQLCDASHGLEKGWEIVFDRDVGKKFAKSRERVSELKLDECVQDFEEMRRRTAIWESPPLEDICKLGLVSK